MDAYKSTGLWKRSFGSDLGPTFDEQRSILKAAYAVFRERASALTAQIAKALPNLTIHDVSHLDALWETADLIAGDGYPLNPAEAFVFGGAVLIHDAALCFEAYQSGQTGLRETLEWKDAYAAIKARGGTRTFEENMAEADFAAIRLLHAKRASDLALQSWKTAEGEELYLIESYELRKHYGKLIGDIAASHHWPIEDVFSKLQSQLNAPALLPREWRVDPVKVACLLRCADAAHIDSRRAPDFLRALANLHGISAQHWTAQNWLERADRDSADPEQNSIVFTSGKPFNEENSEAWWVAYDAIRLIQKELSSSAELLERRPQANTSPPFQMRRVTGSSSPTEANKTIRTVGWSPQAVEIHVSNLERLISQLGGKKLYGEEQSIIIVLREIIQNARDAVIARRAIDSAYKGMIRVNHLAEGETHTISVEDDGVGMSYRVMTGPLLDFGASFWASDLVRSEFPGLLSGGYRPVGKFGIGFYSIFMAASSASISSRRFDGGLSEVTQVKFPNGLSLRPLITLGAPTGFGYETSTLVRLQLKRGLGNPDSIVISNGRPGYEPETRLPLSQCLAIICAGLDVTVELVDSARTKTIVHRPLSELKTPTDRRKWLFDLAAPKEGSAEHDIVEDHAKRLRPIVKDGQTFGMAALSTAHAPNHNALGSVMTVGGLATTIGKTDFSKFLGSIDYEPITARRDPSLNSTTGQEAVNAWANEQKALLPDRLEKPLDWCIATCSLADLKVDPIDIATVLVKEGENFRVMALDGLIDVICEKGLAFYQSSIIRHVETHHSQGCFNDIPTFWPVMNSSFLSLERDGDGVPPLTSILSCIERRARERGISIVSSYASETRKSHFGLMPVLLLKAPPSHE